MDVILRAVGRIMGDPTHRKFGKGLERWLNEAKTEIGWDKYKRVFGVHVRRGDALSTSLGFGTDQRSGSFLETYLHYADFIYQQYEFDTIYLTTKSQEEIEKARRLGPQILSLDISCDFFPTTQIVTSTGTNFIEDYAKDEPSIIEQIVVSALLDLHFLQVCDGLVGSQSIFSQVAWYLMVCRLGYVPPFACL